MNINELLPFIGIPIFFLVFIVVFRYIIPKFGGWGKLAERYRTSKKSAEIQGERIHFGEINIGGFNMKNMVKGYKTPEGLFLTQYLFFFGNAPNVLIPWEAFQTPERNDFLFIKRVRIPVGFPSTTYLILPEKKYRLLEDHLPKKLRKG